MSSDTENRKRAEAQAAATRLAKETGISMAQATELVEALGQDWASLVREARLLRKQR